MHTQQQTLWEWAAQRPSIPTSSIRRRPVAAMPLGQLNLDGLSMNQEAALMAQWTEQGRVLQAALTKRLRTTVHLTLTQNKRRMLSTRRDQWGFHVRLHFLFLGCEAHIVEALALFISGQSQARDVLKRYIDLHHEEVRALTKRAPIKEQLRARGRYHDLGALLDSVLEELSEFEPGPIEITWGRHGRGKRSIRLGSYDFAQRLIRIHPALDQAWVPEYFVEYVIFHEVLHAIFPPEDSAQGRRDIHTHAFCRMERTFYMYDEARAWERSHITKLLEHPV